MTTYQHPASLNALQQFRQACSILRETSRAGNAGWYEDALELNLQLHIRVDGTSAHTLYFDRRKGSWSKGPAIREGALHDSTEADEIIAEALRHARSNGATSLGVILHIADEFATNELKPDLNNPAALPELRDAAIADPGSILDDSSIVAAQATWRVLPYPAAGSDAIGTTVTLSRQYTPFLTALRQAGEAANFPIVSHTLSAPLIAIAGLAQSLKPTPGKPFVAILQYPWLTVLAFFNEHADLRLIRTLQHRGLRRATNFRNALATTNASLEFVDPDLFLVPLGSNVDTTLDMDLRVTFSSSRVEVIQQIQIEGIPDWCPEPAISALPVTPDGSLVYSNTFSTLRDEKWAFQDFLPTPKEIAEIYPSRSEMRLLKIIRLARVAVFAIAVLCLAYVGFGMIDLVRHPEWAFDPSQAQGAKRRLSQYNVERQKADHWNNLLEDRSKAWTSMESLARMFPADSGMLVKTYSHATKPDSTPGKAKIGFVKEWKITGYARDNALNHLNSINTREGISAHFNEIAQITGNTAFSPNTGNRNLVVNVRTQENTSYKSVPVEDANNADETTYPFTFDLTITQRFEATDPMSINVAKAP